MTMDQFSEVVQTKVQGTEYLVKLLPPSSLDFFVILSSIVGIIGGPIQGNYAAASTFQGAYARYLTSIGQPVTTLDLGWIQGAGYVEESAVASAFIEEKGMKPVPLNTLLQALSYAITRKPENADQSQLMVGLSHTLKSRFLRVPKFSFVQVRQSLESSSNVSSAGPSATQSIQQTIQNCKSLDEATTFISEKLLEKISLLMAIPLSNLRLEASSSDYGIDSLIAIELKNWMRLELGCNLGTFEILGSNTIANLGELAAQRSRWLAELGSPDAPAGKDKDVPGRSKSESRLSLTPSPLSPNNGNMPNLPVPSLDVTTSALLKSLRLVLSEEEYERSKACVDSFLSPEGQGHTLQARLLDRARTTRNWLSDIWINKKYLERRTPIAPFTNYFVCHEISGTSSVSERAACICAAVLEFQAEVENDTLARDRIRDAYADMNQYKNLFNACRIPQKSKDCLVRFDTASNRHIAVIRAGHYFKLSYEHQGQRLDRAQLKAAIDSILEMDLGSTIGVGALTTSNRDIWAEARANLMATSPEAKRSIEEIERSCFVLCLDTEQPKTLEELAAQIWYGNGSNRWFDKPTQWVVTANGRSGYIGEHSATDGGPSVRLNDYVQDFIRKASGRPTDMTSDLDKHSHNVKPIKFPITDELSKLVLTARSQFEQTTSAEEIVPLSLDRFGQEAIASGKRNANTCIQLILNLAAYRMYGELKPNSEPVSLSSFADGRCSTCSMVTEEVLKFCQLADDPKANQAARLGAFDAARIAHGKNLSRTADGPLNTEAHLLALKQMLNENEETPELFLDQLLQKSQRWFFNATYLPSNHEVHYGHRQFNEDGFGIGSMIRADRFDLLICTANGRGKELSSHIKRAADDVGIMLGIIS
ncbi:carnitine O-acetyltransferase protein [Rutstroemia sp. NJR-2017a BBW]|nr:carnitine O-acetyltransferase protein [Rutstroemia sp. NJR-2017a BBW]